MLQSSYRSLRRYFAPRPYMEIRLRVLRLRRWKVPLAVYRRRFQTHCEFRVLDPDAETLRGFEALLTAEQQRMGAKPFRVFLCGVPFRGGGSAGGSPGSRR